MRRLVIAAVLAVGLAGVGVSSVHAAQPNSNASCTLTSEVLGGSDVISAYAVDVSHNHYFEIDWNTPWGNAEQYVSSTAQGTVGQTENNLASGTYTASFFDLGSNDNQRTFVTSCSVSV